MKEYVRILWANFLLVEDKSFIFQAIGCKKSKIKKS